MKKLSLDIDDIDYNENIMENYFKELDKRAALYIIKLLENNWYNSADEALKNWYKIMWKTKYDKVDKNTWKVDIEPYLEKIYNFEED